MSNNMFINQKEDEKQYIEKYIIPKVGPEEAFKVFTDIDGYCIDMVKHLSLSSVSYGLQPKETIELFSLYVNNIIIGVNETIESGGDVRKGAMESIKRLDVSQIAIKVAQITNKISNPILNEIFMEWMYAAVSTVNNFCKAALLLFDRLNIRIMYGLFMIRFNNIASEIDLENIVRVANVNSEYDSDKIIAKVEEEYGYK